MADRQPACRKRGPAAVEPPEYMGATKTCTNCGSAQHSVFKFLNNKKPDQPRYRCMRCKTYYTHYPPGKARARPHGKKYSKHTLGNPPGHAAMFDLRCPNLVCRAQNPAHPHFLYLNNNNSLQPRYECLMCQASWQPKLKNVPPRPDEVAPTLEYPNGAPNFMDAMQDAMQGMQQYVDPTNDMTSMGSCIEDPNDAPNRGNHLEEDLASSRFDVDAIPLQLCGEQYILYPELDPTSLEFHALDVDTKQAGEEQDAPEAECGMDEWMVELFPTTGDAY